MTLSNSNCGVLTTNPYESPTFATGNKGTARGRTHLAWLSFGTIASILTAATTLLLAVDGGSLITIQFCLAWLFFTPLTLLRLLRVRKLPLPSPLGRFLLSCVIALIASHPVAGIFGVEVMPVPN